MDINQRVWQKPDYFIAFGFGLGTLPVAPGTWGTLAGIPLLYLIYDSSWLVYLIITAVLFVFGVWLCDIVTKDIGVHDHGGIVWDEIVGFLLTMFLCPLSLTTIVLGFLLFRLFDILKPPPIRYVDKVVKGGFGIMVDDILAAIYAWCCLQFMVYLFGLN